ELSRSRGRPEGQHHPQRERHRRAQARACQAPVSPHPSRYEALDLLATMVAVVAADGRLQFVNAVFETAAGLSRKALMRTTLFDWVAEGAQLRETVNAVLKNEITTGRFDGTLKRAPVAASELLPVHVIVTQLDQRSDSMVLVEMLEI